MGTGLPFIFQVVLLLLLPLAFAYLFSVVGIVLMPLYAALKSRFRRKKSDPSDPAATPH